MKKPLSGYESLKKYLVESCGAEDLDELKPRPPQGMRISDYTFENRSVIVELKHISNVSAGNNIRTYPGLVEAHMKHGLNPRTGYPEFSKWSEAEIAQYKRFFLDDTTFIQKMFSKADKQIRDTKKLLEISKARGMLFILNTCHNVNPVDINYRCFNFLFPSNGEQPRYANVESVLCYSVDSIEDKAISVILERFQNPKEYSFVSHLLDLLERNRENRTGLIGGSIPLNISWANRKARLLPEF